MGSIVQGLGDILGGQAAKKEADFNAKLLERQAERTVATSKINAGEFSRREGRKVATSRANTGGSGVTQSGSVLDAAADAESEIAFQTAKIIAGGQADAQSLENQAQLTRFSGKQRRKAGIIKGGAKFGEAAASTAGPKVNYFSSFRVKG